MKISYGSVVAIAILTTALFLEWMGRFTIRDDFRYVIWGLITLAVMSMLAAYPIKITQAMKTAFFWLWTAGAIAVIVWMITTFGLLILETGAVIFALAILTVLVRIATVSDEIRGDLKKAVDHIDSVLENRSSLTYDEVKSEIKRHLSSSDQWAASLRNNAIRWMSHKKKIKVDDTKKTITRR